MIYMIATALNGGEERTTLKDWLEILTKANLYVF